MADQEKKDEGWGDHANMSFVAGYIIGLSSTDRPLNEEDRRLLKKAGEYLRRHAFALYFEKYGELP